MEKKKLKLLVCALAIGLSVSLANADIETDLVGYWAFEDCLFGDTTADSSGNGHDGTLVGDPCWATGLYGAAMVFDGDEDRVVLGTSSDFDLSEAFTISAWVNPASLIGGYGGNNPVVNKYGSELVSGYIARRGWYFRVESSGAIKTRVVNPNQNGTSLVSDPCLGVVEIGTWAHMATTYEYVADQTSKIRLYLNGSLVGSSDTARGPINIISDWPAWIGAYQYNTAVYSSYFDGEIDDVRIYSRVLSATDISDLAAYDPTALNFAPNVDAGSYPSVLVNTPLQLDGSSCDDGKPAVPGEVTLTWSKVSGPGTAIFTDTTIEDPCVTFNTNGIYELRLRADDGELDPCDVVTIRVKAANAMIAHWDFDEGTGTTVNDSVNNNDGDLAGDKEPNWVSGWVGSDALEFYGEGDPCVVHSYVDITTDPAPDPNLDNIQYEISLAAWIKVDEIQSAYPVIIAKGNNSWRMGLMTGEPVGRLYVSYVGTTGTKVYSYTLLNDNNWHHVVGVYDGSMSYLYVDGILEGSAERTGLINVDDLPVTIGARATSATEVERSWNGLIDDVRVYNYGISHAEVLDLVAMGQGTVPTVVIDTANETVVYMRNGAFQLDATVTDDTPPQATLEWTQESGPGTATIDPCNIEDPCVTFSEVGTYVLRLTASDPLGNVFDEVTLIVEDPTCDDVIADGKLIMGDISGPAGDPDCYIDLYDFAAFAGNWLRCNDPQDPDCEFLY
ncbi:MAG: hypothetical protein KAT56_09405 [Sedimentisphaerales bacterium]|nr:hypothetical protein [Sedimentisphaerales bacterium]